MASCLLATRRPRVCCGGGVVRKGRRNSRIVRRTGGGNVHDGRDRGRGSEDSPATARNAFADTVKTVISGNPYLGSAIIYRGHFYIHTFGYVFHGMKMDSLRLGWISKEEQLVHDWSVVPKAPLLPNRPHLGTTKQRHPQELQFRFFFLLFTRFSPSSTFLELFLEFF